MKNSPILITPGEPNSIFFEIFFKSLKYKNFRSPLILICCKKFFLYQFKKHNFKKKLCFINIENIKKYHFDKNYLYLIDIELKKSKNRHIQKSNTKKYLEKSFNIAFQLLDLKLTKKFINGPINKESFLKKKYLGMTEYFSKKMKVKKYGMLIYNKNLSV